MKYNSHHERFFANITYFCGMKRSIPDYLAEANNLVVTVVITALFSVAFLCIYSTFSETAWFNLHDSTRFILTVGFISTSLLIIVISKTLLYYRHRKQALAIWKYIVWNILEILIIAAIYTAVTITLISDEGASWPWIYCKALLITAISLVIPYVCVAFAAAERDKNKILKVVNSRDIVSDELPKSDNDLIHITDNNGNLKLSIRLENLLYIESQDNYVKVYYTTQGKLQSYLVRCKLKTLEENFSADGKLARCHRSYIVNTTKVKVLRKEMNNYVVDLDNGGTMPIPVSKKYFESFAASLRK